MKTFGSLIEPIRGMTEDPVTGLVHIGYRANERKVSEKTSK